VPARALKKDRNITSAESLEPCELKKEWRRPGEIQRRLAADKSGYEGVKGKDRKILRLA
jgi:hypothetical protein